MQERVGFAKEEIEEIVPAIQEAQAKALMRRSHRTRHYFHESPGRRL